ncbi:MAG: hypothetical protein L0228_00540 [Planctomycetes bacterium]|nr:hypothetical protein [Planctomycetota bacterium]
MATLAHFAARPARTAVALAAALALLLPLPARCASCSSGDDRCPRCAAAQVAESLRSKIRRGEDSNLRLGETQPHRDSHSASRRDASTCCQRRESAHSAPTSGAAVGTAKHVLHTCGCRLLPVQRTTPPVEKVNSSPELVAGLSLVAILPLNPSACDASAGDFTLANLPPPIPHRILHCSWII